MTLEKAKTGAELVQIVIDILLAIEDRIAKRRAEAKERQKAASKDEAGL